MSRQLISFDWAIKRLLRNKANFGILEGFLSELLKSDITIVEILESETNKTSRDNRQSRVDIKVRDSKGDLILIEIQYSRELDYLFRIMFETAKCIAEHLKEGIAYSGAVKVISVSILYFDFCKGDDYIYYGTSHFYGVHSKTELALNPAQQKLFNLNSVSNIFPEHYIINIKNFNDIAVDTVDEWIYFLKNEKIKDNFSAKGLLEAKEKLNVLTLNESERADYEQYQKELHHQASNYESTYVIGRMEGQAIGEAKGVEKERLVQEQKRHQEKIDSAKKMLERGFAIDDITEFTGLSEAEIKTLTN